MKTLLIAASAALLVGTAFAQTYTVDRVIIQGARSVPADQLQQSLSTHPGSRVTTQDIVADQDNLEKALERAHVTGGIKTGMRNKNNGHIDVIYTLNDTGIQQPQVIHKTVYANAKLAQVSFEGNKKVSTDRLAAAAQMRPGDEITEAYLKAAAARIMQTYKDVDERTAVGIQAKPTAKPDGTADITWVITEKKAKRNTEDEGGQAVEQ